MLEQRPEGSADETYVRQLILPEIGPAGQARLMASRVLVVGAGGLGSPALFALAGAGIGHLTILDQDTVSRSNLNRQFLYAASDLGLPKASVARDRLLAYNPSLEINAIKDRLTEPLAIQLFCQFDVVLAAVDNRETRRLINRVAYSQRKPWIDGGIRGFSGYVAAFVPGVTACLDCCFDWDDPDSASLGLNRAHPREPIGALGATASVIGSLEATIAIHYLLGLGWPLPGQILYYHGRSFDFAKLAIEPREHCPICGGQT
jgi:adenylyltransferase/sulfurtransferase